MYFITFLFSLLFWLCEMGVNLCILILGYILKKLFDKPDKL